MQLVKKFPAFHGTRKFTHLCLGILSGPHPSGFPSKTLYVPLSPHPYVPHAQPISFFPILSPTQYRVRSTSSTYYTYLLTPWCRVLLEKVTGLQLVKKFSAFHGTRNFTHLCLGHLSGPLPSGFPRKTLYAPLSPHPYLPHAQPISFFPILSPTPYRVRSTSSTYYTYLRHGADSFLRS